MRTLDRYRARQAAEGFERFLDLARPAPSPAAPDPGPARPRERLALARGDRDPTGRFWFLPYYDPRNSVTEAQRSAFKVMMRCPVIKSAIYSKALAVASLDWQVQPAKPDSPRDLEACDFLRHCIDRLPDGMPGLVQALTVPRLIDGYAVAEKVRTVEQDDQSPWRGKVVLDDVKAKPTEIYDLVVDRFANVTGVRGVGPNDGETWPIADFVYTRHLPLYDNPLGTSDLAAAYSAHWMEDTVTKLRAIHAEKYTTPMLLGETEEDNRSALGTALEQAKSRTWLVVPTGAKVSALTLAAQGEADFKSFVDDCQKRKLIGIVGAYLQTLEGAVTDGRGSASVSKSITELFQWILAVAFQEAANKQLFPELTRLNFLGIGVPRLVLGGVSEQELATILGNMVLAQSLGLELSKKDTYRRTSYQMPKDKADLLVPPAPAVGLTGLPPQVEPAAPGAPAASPGEAVSQASPLLQTVGGAGAVAALQAAFYANEVSREAALAQATIVFGLDQATAEKLFPPPTAATQATAAAKPIAPGGGPAGAATFR